MSDRDALMAAICAEPDEDTPRLVLADYLEENSETARAAFVRAQVELARCRPWEPLAVQCRWRLPDVVSGKPFFAALPRVDGYHVKWTERPFRRGFGWALNVCSVEQWGDLAEPLFDREPIGAVAFWHGTLDNWTRVAASHRLKHLRELTFHSNPIEPLRALRDEPAVCGVTDLWFRRASGAGMPEVVEDLVRSPLGRAIGGLHFHAGWYESLNDLIDALNTRNSLDRLSFSVMGITADHLRRLFAGPVASALTELHLRDELLGGEGLHALADGVPAGLCDLELPNVGTPPDGLEALARCDRLTNLRRLNLSRNALKPRAVRVLSLSHSLAGLRALDLSECRIEDKSVRHLTRAKFWSNLVELDLRKNPISPAGTRYLLDAPTPPDLTALVLDGDQLGADTRAALTKKYGAAIVFTATEVPVW
jgi:uncharacterized protein (TIGR02996 family)